MCVYVQASKDKQTKTRCPLETLECTTCGQILPGTAFYPRHKCCIACQIAVNSLQRAELGASRGACKAMYAAVCKTAEFQEQLLSGYHQARDNIHAATMRLLESQTESPGHNAQTCDMKSCCGLLVAQLNTVNAGPATEGADLAPSCGSCTNRDLSADHGVRDFPPGQYQMETLAFNTAAGLSNCSDAADASKLQKLAVVCSFCLEDEQVRGFI